MKVNSKPQISRAFAVALTLFALGCDTQKEEGIGLSGTGEETGESGGEPMDTPRAPAQPRMTANVYHPSMHLFTEGFAAAQVTARARKAKELALGDADAPTCYVGPQGTAQFAVQTEFAVHEYIAAGESTRPLDERLDALFEEGLAVHLLLPVHYVDLLGKWKGLDWEQAKNWSNHSNFMPIKPCAEAWTAEGQCPYDVLFEHFQRPVIEHLVETGRADKLAVIYVANEFGYNPLTIADGPTDWSGAPDWKRKRAEALAYTAARGLATAREAAASHVPVGLKLIDVANSNTGWTPEPNVIGDQLAYILATVMGPAGDVLAYDVAFDNMGFDSGNRERLSPFLPTFAGGRLELGEFGRICQGLPGEFVFGSRTLPTDITGGAAAWPSSRGLNLFSFNVYALDSMGGCYGLTDPHDFNKVFPGAAEEAAGLWAQIQAFTGSQAPDPCAESALQSNAL